LNVTRNVVAHEADRLGKMAEQRLKVGDLLDAARLAKINADAALGVSRVEDAILHLGRLQMALLVGGVPPGEVDVPVPHDAAPPPGLETAPARFYVDIMCAHCNQTVAALSKSWWMPTGINFDIVMLAGFEVDAALIKLGLASSAFKVGGVSFDYADNCAAVDLEPLLLDPASCGAEEFGLVVGRFLGCGWKMETKEWEPRWVAHMHAAGRHRHQGCPEHGHGLTPLVAAIGEHLFPMPGPDDGPAEEPPAKPKRKRKDKD
jgi:hypothetical protein